MPAMMLQKRSSVWWRPSRSRHTARNGNRSLTASTSRTAPTIWTNVVLEYIGYLLIPSTKAQKMLILTGKGGEGKSRIGLLLKKLLGPAAHMEAVLRLETNRFASANLEHKLVMIDDDLNMTALPETRNIKSFVTAEDRICVERKGKQATQGLLYARLLCFGNGNLVAAHDTSDGFWRRQILISVKDKPEDRTDDPYLIDKLSEELSGILLWALEGLKRLLANQYRFTRYGGRLPPRPVHAG